MQSHCSEDVSAELPQEGASVKLGKVLVQGRCRSPLMALLTTPIDGPPQHTRPGRTRRGLRLEMASAPDRGFLCRERGDWRLRIALCSALHAMNCRWQRWLTNNDDNGNLWQWQFMMWMRSMTMTTRTIKGQMQSAAMQSKAYAIKGWWT